jgi:hypothetical protein
LRREEEVIRRFVVVCAVLWFLAARFARGVLEEKDHAIDGAQLLELRGLERGELFELYVLNTELLNQICEDTLRMSVAPMRTDNRGNARRQTLWYSSLQT